MPLYLVETISLFRMRYAVECESAQEAERLVVGHLADDEIKEFSQHHVGEPVNSVREIKSEDEFVDLFNIDNAYLSDWSAEKKLSCINNFSDKG
jgi:hypothetical protein